MGNSNRESWVVVNVGIPSCSIYSAPGICASGPPVTPPELPLELPLIAVLIAVHRGSHPGLRTTPGEASRSLGLLSSLLSPLLLSRASLLLSLSRVLVDSPPKSQLNRANRAARSIEQKQTWLPYPKSR
jgi:hypothetical protein